MYQIVQFIKKLANKEYMYSIFSILGISIIIFVLYMTQQVWISWFTFFIKIIKPFIIGFIIAYIFYPLVSFFERYHIKRGVAIFLLIILILLLIFIFMGKLLPLLYQYAMDLSSTFHSGIKEIEEVLLHSFNLDLSNISDYLYTKINEFIEPDFLVNTSISMVSQILSFIGNLIIYIVLSIYFLFDYNRIRQKIKLYSKSIHPKLPHYLTSIDKQLTEYFKAFGILMLIQAIMYGAIYALLGHPDWVILGLLTGISGIFPYIGTIIANTFGLITTLSLGSTKAFILIILICIVSNIDAYYITPKIYSKKIKIEPIWSIMALIIGSSLFGALGIIVAMPTLIILKITYLTYQKQK